MAEWGGDRRGGSRGRATTWDVAARRRRALAWGGRLADFGKTVADRLRNWAIADTGPGRLLPWLPIAFGLGIAIYFGAEREPAWWAAASLVLVCAVLAFLARRRPVAFPLALAGAAVAAGFAVATLKAVYVGHPVLARPAMSVAIAGFVEVREERERTDRIVVRALTLRTLAIAALGGAAVRAAVGRASELPDVVCGDARADRGLRARAAVAGECRHVDVGARVALWGGREIAALMLASLVAGLATTPYAAFHFHRIAPYGVIANLLAMPIVSVWVMPSGLLALIAMPFGFDGMLWRLMGEGIDWMIAVALWVASLPGAVGRMAAFGIGPLLLGTGGLVLLCLLQDAAALERRRGDRRREPLGGRARRSRTCWSRPTARRWRCAAPTDGFRSIAGGRDAFAVARMARGRRRRAAAGRCDAWGRASAATRRAASRRLADGRLVAHGARAPTPSRRIAARGRGGRDRRARRRRRCAATGRSTAALSRARGRDGAQAQRRRLEM